MSRFAVFAFVLVAMSLPAHGSHAEKVVHETPGFVTVILADRDGGPAISLQSPEIKIVTSSLSLGSGSNAVSITPFVGGIELKTPSCVIRTTELRLNIDLLPHGNVSHNAGELTVMAKDRTMGCNGAAVVRFLVISMSTSAAR